MSNLKRLRLRVKSIKATQKITKAMQMVAASKLKKIRDKITDSEGYLDALRVMMAEVSGADQDQMLPSERIFFDSDELAKRPALMIVMTSERGLCGSFNLSIMKKVRADIAEFEKSGREFRIIAIGKKGYDALKGKYSAQISDYFVVSKENEKILPFEIRHQIMDLITGGHVGTCRLYFSRFKNVLTQLPQAQVIFPLEKPDSSISANSSKVYEFEGAALVTNMINLYLTGQINYSLLQNKAGEEGARMTAMDNATKNAGEMIDRLTLQLNRTRQAVITKELIEIISGAEAV